MTEVYQAIFASLAELPNLQLIFDRKGVYLEKDGDAVTGVVCVDAAGTYHRYRANEAVVLAAGDFSADKEMMTDLCVTANDCLQAVSYTHLGSLDAALDRLSANFFDDAILQIDAAIDNIEPALAAFLTIAVGATLISVMLPLIGIMGSIG